jgi:hypothetical protein
MSLYRPKPVARSEAPRLSRWREALRAGQPAGE